MHMWHIKIKMRGENEPREQPAIFKASMPVKNDVIEDLIVDGAVVRAKIISFQKARSTESGYDIEAEQIA